MTLTLLGYEKIYKFLLSDTGMYDLAPPGIYQTVNRTAETVSSVAGDNDLCLAVGGVAALVVGITTIKFIVDFLETRSAAQDEQHELEK